MEVLGTIFSIQLVVVVLSCVAGLLVVTSDRKKLRSFSVSLQLVAFIVSFAIGGFYLTFLDRSFVAAVGPCIVLLLLALSIWKDRAAAKERR